MTDYLTLYPKGKPKRRRLPLKGRGFHTRTRGRFTLLTPDIKKGWDADERILRSIIYDREGKVVSCGLPKFFTVDKERDDAISLQQALDDGEEVLWTVKYDGSLAIRSVFGNGVVFRTRNSFDGENYGDRMTEVAAERYPQLTDKTVCANISLLFEFVSTKTRVILEYDEDDLILIGGINHNTLRMLSYGELSDIANEHSLRLVETVGDFVSVDEAQAWVNGQSGLEGLVARWGRQQRLLKVKNADYELAHKMRFALHPKKVWQLYHEKGLRTPEQFLNRFDVPNDSSLNPYLSDLIERASQLEQEVEDTLEELTSLCQQRSAWTRKKFSAAAHELAVPHNVALLALRENNSSKARKLLINEWVAKRFTDTVEGRAEFKAQTDISRGISRGSTSSDG